MKPIVIDGTLYVPVVAVSGDPQRPAPILDVEDL